MQHNGEKLAETWELPRGRAFGSLALGVVSILFGPILLGVIPGITGIVLGVKQIRHGQAARKVAYAGTGLSVIGTLISLTPVFLFCLFVLPNMTLVTKAVIPSPFVQAAAMLSPEQRQRWSAYAPENQVALASVEKWIGVKAPDLILSDDKENKERLSDQLGKKVLVACLEPEYFSSAVGFPFDLIARLSTSAGDAKVYGVFYFDGLFAGQTFKDEPFSSYKFPIRLTSPNKVPEAFAVDATPVLIVIDRNGVIQHVFGGKEPEAEIITALSSVDYQGEQRLAPITTPENGETPVACGELVKNWEIKAGALSNLEAPFPGAYTAAEIVYYDDRGCMFIGDDGSILSEHKWPTEYRSIFATATCKPSGRRKVAIWGSTLAQTLGEDSIVVFDENWQPLWTQSVKAAGDGMLAWVELVKNDGPSLLASSGNSHAALYSAEGKFKHEWGEAPSFGQKEQNEGIKKETKRSRSRSITPLGLFTDKRLGSYFLDGGNPAEACFIRPNGKSVRRIHFEGSGFPRIVLACYSGVSQTPLMGIVSSHGSCHRELFSVLDGDGKFCWTRDIGSIPSQPADVIAAVDCFGDAAKEWLVMGKDALQVISHDGKLLCRVALPTTPGIRFEKDRDGKDVSVPEDMPPEKMRIAPRSGKSALLLMQLSNNWVAYELKLTVQN